MKPISLTAYTMTSCLGAGLGATRRALREGASGLAKLDFETVAGRRYLAVVAGLAPAALEQMPYRLRLVGRGA